MRATPFDDLATQVATPAVPVGESVAACSGHGALVDGVCTCDDRYSNWGCTAGNECCFHQYRREIIFVYSYVWGIFGVPYFVTGHTDIAWACLFVTLTAFVSGAYVMYTQKSDKVDSHPTFTLSVVVVFLVSLVSMFAWWFATWISAAAATRTFGTERITGWTHANVAVTAAIVPFTGTPYFLVGDVGQGVGILLFWLLYVVLRCTVPEKRVTFAQLLWHIFVNWILSLALSTWCIVTALYAGLGKGSFSSLYDP